MNQKLFELLIVLVSLVLLVAVIVPSAKDAADEAATQSFVRQLQAWTEAANLYAAKTGTPVEACSAGQLPPGFGRSLDAKTWTAPTPIGGAWDIERDTWRIEAALGVEFRGSDYPGDAVMLAIDDAIDDGRLGHGRFRCFEPGRFYWILAD